MGTLAVEKSTLKAMILDIFLKDKAFFKDILREIVKHDPHYIEELTFTDTSAFVEKPLSVSREQEKERQNLSTEGVSDEELNYWVGEHFKEYGEVFKALA